METLKEKIEKEIMRKNSSFADRTTARRIKKAVKDSVFQLKKECICQTDLRLIKEILGDYE